MELGKGYCLSAFRFILCAMSDLDAFNNLAAVIRKRRTHKKFNGEAVSEAQLNKLLELLPWAPCHRMTQPWRAYVLGQSAVRELGTWLKFHIDELLAFSSKPAKDRGKIAKLSDYYFGSLGALIQVTQVRSENESQDMEDYGAVCASIQNMLLGAEAMGLAHFWSTSALMANPVLLRHLSINPDSERLVASLWLGGRVDDPSAPERDVPYVKWIE